MLPHAFPEERTDLMSHRIIELAFVAACASLLSVSAARAEFSGYYAPANFAFANSNADGFVNTSASPASIILTGGNLSPMGFSHSGVTTFSIATDAGLVSFNWNYSTADDAANYDPFVFRTGGAEVLRYSTSASKTGFGFLSLARCAWVAGFP